MSQVVIDVILLEEDGEDFLKFIFDSGEEKINLNSDSFQEEIKKVFSTLLKVCLENDIVLNYKIEENYTRTLYKEVCEEYVNDLQKEVDLVKNKIRKEMHIS